MRSRQLERITRALSNRASHLAQRGRRRHLGGRPASLPQGRCGRPDNSGRTQILQSENPLIADFVKLVNSAAGTVAGMTREARDSGKERLREALGGLDFVSREEFETVKDLALKALAEVEALKSQVAALEAKAA